MSEQFDEVRDTVRNQYLNWRELLLQLNEQCVVTQHKLSINVNEPRELLGGALFARTLASSQAAILLLEYGLLAQAKTVLRSALESLFALAAIEAKPALALKLAQSHEANKASLADKIIQWENPDLKASISALIAEAELDKIKSNQSEKFNTYQLADHAGMKDYYLSTYVLLSFPAHASVVDLIYHLITDDYGNVIGLKNEPLLDKQEFTWAIAIEIQLLAAKAVKGIFGINCVDIQAHENALRTLIAQLDN
ncbi:hypothetical protein MGMO_43c00260 [Methyloglobulus morosus KoM1]|uniref:Uncharacterized protein n=1 Tax=Methyloglobulus morosus KoM1 TaxID=1116472 RepID=V5C371_9GAMM|nr:hypothetical protein MGMO_43c00260 [Methyloglobulus morosus KoM1]